MAKQTIQKLWEEKKVYDNHPHSVHQGNEWDSIASSILSIATEKEELTDLEVQAVNWAKKRLGV